MRRHAKKKYNPHVLCCPFKCGLFCRSASGLTQHRNVCSLNPANRRAWTPPTRPVSPSPGPAFPTLDTPQMHHRNISQPHTPGMSPHRYQWTVNGRGGRSRTHPLLNGDVIPSFSVNRLLSQVSVQVNHATTLVMTCLTTPHHPLTISNLLTTFSHTLPVPNLN